MRRQMAMAASLLACWTTLFATQVARAQVFGAELHATMMPASGGMAGASIARPQDVQSAFTGNPATLAQFRGTQFSFGGGWAEPTINVDNDANLPLAGVSPYSAKSEQPGSAPVNLAATQDFSALGMPATWGIGLITGAGLGVNYIDVPESNGSHASMVALHVASGLGVHLTDRFDVGAGAYVTTATLDGPFSGLTASTMAYGLRGQLGATYQATDYTTLGAYWMTKESFEFENAVRLSLGGGAFSVVRDVELDLPETFGWGIANNRLMDGRLLLATDLLYKRYSDCDFYRGIWDDQFVLQTGAQYAVNSKLRLRLGYAYAENNMLDSPSLTIGGITVPGGQAAVQYLQAQTPSISPHRLSGGAGVRDLLPGVDFDVNAGGMFYAEDQFGQSAASVESYWIAFGLTWRFQRGADQPLSVADRW